MESIIIRIKNVLEKIRPFLMNDGGDIDFIKFEDGVVYVKFIGACQHCPHINGTLKHGIEEALTSEIKEVIRVEKI